MGIDDPASPLTTPFIPNVHLLPSACVAVAGVHLLASHAGLSYGALLLDGAVLKRTKAACETICETRLVEPELLGACNVAELTDTTTPVSLSFRSYHVSATLWNEQKASAAASKPELTGAYQPC